MKEKNCIICEELKPLNEYYKHSKMGDGHLNKCKECTKRQARERHHTLNKNEEWVESERARCREKYQRLGYGEKQHEWDASRPWKKTVVYKNLSHKLKLPKGIEAHHWNYADDFLLDVFTLPIREHKAAHGFLTLDFKTRLFRTTDGELLDTREKHFDYLLNMGIKF